MGKYVEKSVRETYSTNRKILEKIYNNALHTRKRAEVSYRPYQVQEFIDMQMKPGVNFADFYSDFCKGDYAWFSSCMEGLFERNILINVKTVCDVELYFNGEKQSYVLAQDGSLDFLVNFKEGKNELLVKVIAGEKEFSAYAVPLVPELRYGAGGDYAYCTWHYIEKPGFRLQSCLEVSRLYRSAESSAVPQKNSIDWVYPVIPAQSNEKNFDFNKLCGKGKCAYAYTYVKGKISISHECPMKIFSEGKEIYLAKSGVFEREYEKLTPLLIKTVKSGNLWGFSAETDGEHALLFVDGADCPDLQWLWIGPFGRESDDIDYPYGPEVTPGFEKPYASVCAGSIYWRFYRTDTYLKQYLHSAFFGQWFYAIMVGHYGMLQSATKLGKTEFYNYFADSIKKLCSHRDYGALDNRLSGYSSYMANGGSNFTRLDPIGTIGINMAEYYMMSNDPDARCLLQILADSLRNNVPRFPDGAFYRVKTMWTDDTYMCLPFMVRLGIIMNDESYFNDILAQVRGFYNRLYMKEENLFSHIFFVEENKANRVPWGRGNGWVLLALSEVLMLLPEDYHGRGEILKIFRDFAVGVLNHRDKNWGIWHQVVNNPESYIETSGSAMFIIALARAVRFGWISSEYKADIEAAWISLTENCIDCDGNVYGICKGSGCNMEEKYYLTLGTMKNDDHGVGIVLSAGVEVMNMLGEM